MLVLRRKAGEAIVLNGVITIYVLAVEGERVKLGISAPPEVVIVRSELLENQGQLGAPGGPLASAQQPASRDTPRPYIQREHEGGSHGDNVSRERDRDRERDPGHQASSARANLHRRGPSEGNPAAPIGSGPLRLP
jgi:carbon storage regulator